MVPTRLRMRRIKSFNSDNEGRFAQTGLLRLEADGYLRFLTDIIPLCNQVVAIAGRVREASRTVSSKCASVRFAASRASRRQPRDFIAFLSLRKRMVAPRIRGIQSEQVSPVEKGWYSTRLQFERFAWSLTADKRWVIQAPGNKGKHFG